MMLKRWLNMGRDVGFRQDERGAAQVEFALTIMTVLIVIVMTIEMCSAIYTYVVLSDAANEGVRYAIVHSSDSTGQASSKVTSYAGLAFHDMSGLSVTVAYPDGQTVPGRVQITVRYPYVPYLKFLSNPPTMHAYAEARLVY